MPTSNSRNKSRGSSPALKEKMMENLDMEKQNEKKQPAAEMPTPASEKNLSPSENKSSGKKILPVHWWNKKKNFGDALSPWLASRLYNGEVEFNNGAKGRKTHLVIGSVISKATPRTHIWGAGSFGTETMTGLSTSHSICKEATYHAVRGPLTRNLLRVHGVSCPSIYGDPALLTPYFYNPYLKKEYEVGVIIRWSETKHADLDFGEGVKKIFFATDKIEETINDILSCKRIMSSAMHGIIIADAYGIPSAWLYSSKSLGLAFKYYDYMLSVNKVQHPQAFPFNDYIENNKKCIELVDILTHIKFDDRKIDFNPLPLLKACPFIDADVLTKLKRRIAMHTARL